MIIEKEAEKHREVHQCRRKVDGGKVKMEGKK